MAKEIRKVAWRSIADAPPVNGVLQFIRDSLIPVVERLQGEFPAAKFVKAFNSVGAACMVNSEFTGGKPTMFICGNDDPRKIVDMGSAEAPRAIEPLCILWCIPGFRHNDCVHAFKLLRQSPACPRRRFWLATREVWAHRCTASPRPAVNTPITFDKCRHSGGSRMMETF